MALRPSREATAAPPRNIVRFAVVGAFWGLAVGFCEAGMIYFVPSVKHFVRSDASVVIWFLAIPMDLGLFTVLGAAVGAIAAKAKTLEAQHVAILHSVLAAFAGAYLATVGHFIQHQAGEIYAAYDPETLLFPVVKYSALFFLTTLTGQIAWRRVAVRFDMRRLMGLRSARVLLTLTAAISISGTVYYATARWMNSSSPIASHLGTSARPNIVLISLDSARADHFSAYGYGRPTTPNIDRMAAEGILFENAIAPSSWTLPSLASILTGMLPHQHGGDTFRAVESSIATLGEALEGEGYETAAFNANPYYGLAGWGLDQGFHPYEDNASSFDYNLSRTLVGRLAVQPVYENLWRYQGIFRQSAADVNNDIARWFRNRSGRPYFLFVNYFDAHAPYLAPKPFDRRFGAFSNDLARLSIRLLSHRPDSITPEQRASLIAGYDNSLAYTDAQISELVKLVSSSPDLSNTIVIITADHGEAFGEHGFYGHGWDLHREEVHVPLIIFGKGIPSGNRIDQTVGTRSLFATVLDFTLRKDFPLPERSLARFWLPNRNVSPEAPAIISELNERAASLTDSDWQYIPSVLGEDELYRLASDPDEQQNLSAKPEYQGTIEELRAQLEDRERRSVAPWLGPEYLYGLNTAGHDFFNENDPTRVPAARALMRGPHRIGTIQALFNRTDYTVPRRPLPKKEDMVNSLPYQ